MKAVVVSLRNGRAAVLSQDGTFNDIKDDNYSVGQTIEYKPEGSRRILSLSTRAVRAIAASVALVILAAGTFTANTYAYSTVTLDINPSLRYELNYFDRVLRFDAFNNDGEDIVNMISVEVVGKKIDAAIDSTLDALDEENYIGESTPVVMTVDSHFFRTERLKERAGRKMEAWNGRKAEKHENKRIEGESLIVTDELRKKARDKEISPGRVIMMEKSSGEGTLPDTSLNNIDTEPLRDGRDERIEDENTEDLNSSFDHEEARELNEEDRPEEPIVNGERATEKADGVGAREDEKKGTEENRPAPGDAGNRSSLGTAPGNNSGLGTMPGNNGGLNTAPGDNSLNTGPGESSDPGTVPEEGTPPILPGAGSASEETGQKNPAAENGNTGQAQLPSAPQTENGGGPSVPEQSSQPPAGDIPYETGGGSADGSFGSGNEAGGDRPDVEPYGPGEGRSVHGPGGGEPPGGASGGNEPAGEGREKGEPGGRPDSGRGPGGPP